MRLINDIPVLFLMSAHNQLGTSPCALLANRMTDLQRKGQGIFLFCPSLFNSFEYMFVHTFQIIKQNIDEQQFLRVI